MEGYRQKKTIKRTKKYIAIEGIGDTSGIYARICAYCIRVERIYVLSSNLNRAAAMENKKKTQRKILSRSSTHKLNAFSLHITSILFDITCDLYTVGGVVIFLLSCVQFVYVPRVCLFRFDCCLCLFCRLVSLQSL